MAKAATITAAERIAAKYKTNWGDIEEDFFDIPTSI